MKLIEKTRTTEVLCTYLHNKNVLEYGLLLVGSGRFMIFHIEGRSNKHKFKTVKVRKKSKNIFEISDEIYDLCLVCAFESPGHVGSLTVHLTPTNPQSVLLSLFPLPRIIYRCVEASNGLRTHRMDGLLEPLP